MALPTGYTPQASAVDQLNAAISGITGQFGGQIPQNAQAPLSQATQSAQQYDQLAAQYPQQKAADISQENQNANLPQQYATNQALMAMFSKDSQLAQQYSKYQNPAINQTSPTQLSYGGVSVPEYLPILSQAGLSNPNFQGYTDPGLSWQAAASAAGVDAGNLEMGQSVYNYNNTAAQNQVNQDLQNYASSLSGKQNDENYYMGLLNSMLGYDVNQQNLANATSSSSANAGATYAKLKSTYVTQMAKQGKRPTIDGLYYYIEQQQNTLAAQGYDYNQILELQREDRRMLGSGNAAVVAPGASLPAKTTIYDTPGSNFLSTIGGNLSGLLGALGGQPTSATMKKPSLGSFVK